MPSETTNETPSIQIANQIINVANTRMKEGMLPDDIAQGLRHAAANFSAYAFFLTAKDTNDPNYVVEDFVKFFEYYLSAHAPKQKTSSALADTIAQAKDEL